MLLKKLLRRTTVVALLVLVQLAVLVVTALRLSNHYLYVSLAFSLVSAAVAFAVVSRRDNPSYKLAWILWYVGIGILLLCESFRHNVICVECKEYRIFGGSCRIEWTDHCLLGFFGCDQ